MKVVSKKFDRFLEHVLDEHNARRMAADGEKFVARDMVDLLLQLADDPNLDVKLERHGVKAFTQVFLIYLLLYFFILFGQLHLNICKLKYITSYLQIIKLRNPCNVYD
ncbi:hypothetical protein HanIR_Chr12g0569991 [Helianthus annuus]|nr:hypothetical protein HanIR_Chr12g0569991 [Helianthus annuus]